MKRILNVVLTPRETVRLTGTLRDAAGDPVPGIHLSLIGGESSAASAETGVDGSYSFAVSPGEYELSAFSEHAAAAGLPAHWFFQSAAFNLDADQSREIRLPPVSTLTVEVLGKGSAPIANAQVELPNLVGSAELGSLTTTQMATTQLTAHTDAEGRADFPVFAGGATIEEAEEGAVRPPAESGYGFTTFKVPPLEADTTVVVQISGAEDTEAPQVDELSFEPASINTGASAQTVTVNAHITDNLSGFYKGYVQFLSPSGKAQTSASLERISGDANSGDYRAKVPFERFSEAGGWTAVVVVVDASFNQRNLAAGDLEELGFPHVLLVEGEPEEEPQKDTQPPQLKGLSIEPTEIDTSTNEQTVFVDVGVTDNESGFKSGEVIFVGPGHQTFINGNYKLLSGNETEGTYRFEVPFPQGSETGAWNIGKVRLRDHAGNEVIVQASEIEAAELPHTVLVVAAPPSVTQVNPGAGGEAGGTKVQISGSSLAGATAVRFGSTPATSFTVNSSSMITATAPGGTGTVDVTVTTPFGTSGASPADRFTYAPEVSLTSSPNPSVHGQQVTLTAKVTPAAEGAPTPVGTITFLDGSTTLKVANMSKGAATFKTTSLAAGEHKLSAFYSGDSNFGQGGSGAVFQVVHKAATELTLTSSLNPAPYGSAATLKATVEAVAPGAGTPAGTVTFREGEAVLDVVQLAGKNATLSLKSLPPGAHQITATYSGDPNDEASKSEPLTQTIVKASTTTALISTLNPAPYGSSGVLKATVDSVAPAVGTPDGTVTFREGPETLATVPLSGSGVAQYALKAVPPGNYEITATYNGSANYEASGSSLNQVVTKAATELSLTSSLNPAPYGSSATLKATVDTVSPGGGSPDGTVTFSEGKTILATVPLSSSGIAKYALKTTPPGSYEITATYSGAPNYEASEAVIGQTITKASTELALTSTKNPAPKGSSGNLKATVKAVAPGGGTPSGSVTFSEGATVLATVPLSGNAATYPLKSLAVGTHEITATYSGSANYAPSESGISQVITP